MVDYKRAFSVCALVAGTALTGCAVQTQRPVFTEGNTRVAQDIPEIAAQPVYAGSSACRAVNARVTPLQGGMQYSRNSFNNYGGYNYNRMYPNIMNLWGTPRMEQFMASSQNGTFLIMSPEIDSKIGTIAGAAAGVYASGVRNPRDLKDTAKIAIAGAGGAFLGGLVDNMRNAGSLNTLDVCRSDVSKGAYDFLLGGRQQQQPPQGSNYPSYRYPR